MGGLVGCHGACSRFVSIATFPQLFCAHLPCYPQPFLTFSEKPWFCSLFSCRGFSTEAMLPCILCSHSSKSFSVLQALFRSYIC